MAVLCKILVALLLICSTINAQLILPGPVMRAIAAAGGGSPTYLLKQGFEGTGYDNSETWSEDGTPDEDYTGVVLDGSQSFRVNAGGTFATSPSYTAQSEAWAYYMFRPVSLPSGVCNISYFFGSFSPFGNVILNTDGTLTYNHGGVSATTVAAMSAGTTYHVWVRYKKGTGANGEGSVAFSTTTTKPTSGNNFAGLSNGAGATDVTQLRIGLINSVTGDCIWDKVRVDDVNIGDAPE